MKTQERNQAEVMNYLNQSSKHVFQSEDGTVFQAIVKSGDKFLFIKNEEVHIINIDQYIGYFPTEAKTKMKQKFHPTWDVNEKYYKGYGIGPSKKPRAVKHYKALTEQIEKIIFEFETKNTSAA